MGIRCHKIRKVIEAKPMDFQYSYPYIYIHITYIYIIYYVYIYFINKRTKYGSSWSINKHHLLITPIDISAVLMIANISNKQTYNYLEVANADKTMCS